MKSAGKARNNGLYRHIRTSKEIIRNLLNDYFKDTFEKPSATRWTEIFQNFFCLSNPGTGILATGGTEKFCFHFLQRRDFENAKYPGGKISPLIYYYNRQGAKWPGARTGNKKSSKSFSDLLLSLVAGGGWYSVLKV